VDVRTGIAYTLIGLAVVGAAVGVWFVVAAGGHEPQPIRAAGVELLVAAGLLGLAGILILRSRR
jgi:hypothetical protein